MAGLAQPVLRAALMASLGVSCARYGVPWHRIQPTPTTWHWHHADEPLERLLEHGIAPQVDLVHYGLPSWPAGAHPSPAHPPREHFPPDLVGATGEPLHPGAPAPPDHAT